MRSAILLVTLVACSSVSAADFNVGPYKLGITNAQAAKYGLKECKQTYSAIECKPTFDSTNIREAAIKFDPKSKRVIEIRASVTHFPFERLPGDQVNAALARTKWTDADWYRMAKDMDVMLRRTLKLTPCQSKLIGYDNYTNRKTEDCHVLPDATRTIAYAYNNTYDGGGRHGNDPHVTAYVRLKKSWEAQAFVSRQREEARKRRKQAALQAFESGR